MKEFFFTSQIARLRSWGLKHSVWTLPIGGSCCGLEVEASQGAKLQLSNLGVESLNLSPEQSNVLMVMGSITEKIIPDIFQSYMRMPKDRYVLALGACACSAGPYEGYGAVRTLDEVLPVDVYVPGCPPTPENIVDGLVLLQKMIEKRAPRPEHSLRQKKNYQMYEMNEHESF